MKKNSGVLFERMEDSFPDLSVAEKITKLRNLMVTNDPLFIIRFHEFFPKVICRLCAHAAASLTASDIEICAYTKLYFSTKEIARHRKLSVRAVENRKYRIRKKLGIPPGEDFVLWISRVRLT